MKCVCFVLLVIWQVLSCCFVDGVITKKSNSMTTLEDFKIRTRTKRATNGLSSAQQTESVDKHNELRSAEQAADMKFMVHFNYFLSYLGTISCYQGMIIMIITIKIL